MATFTVEPRQKSPVFVWMTADGQTSRQSHTGTLPASKTKLTVMQLRKNKDWRAIGTIFVEPSADGKATSIPIREFVTPPGSDWRHYWDWINTATKPSGKITFSGLKVIDHTPAQVKEAHKAINTALDTHFSLKPTPGIKNPLGFSRALYANWEFPSPVTAFNGIPGCMPIKGVWEDAIEFALGRDQGNPGTLDDLASMACAYFAAKWQYEHDDVDVLTPFWASLGRGDCEDLANSALSMLLCLDPSTLQPGSMAHKVALRVKNDWHDIRMMCGYVLLPEGVTGHAWLCAKIDGKLTLIETTEAMAQTPGLPNSLPRERYLSYAFTFSPDGAWAATVPETGTVGVKSTDPVVWKPLAAPGFVQTGSHTPASISMNDTVAFTDANIDI